MHVVAYGILVSLVMTGVVPGALDLTASSRSVKSRSIFFPPELVENGRSNCVKYEWARQARDTVVAAAEPWLCMSDDEVWGLMFGPTITRSWMVWSNGFCPSCRKSVPMYTWVVDAIHLPWKVRCPHCGEIFPKNDFYRFYLSGLDERGVFDPSRADRGLLYNVEHPDPSDPLHQFGVDDGEGWVEGDHRWRFIGAYLIYGQWKQLVLGGLRNLAAAYLATGNRAYAHKAAIILDRVADLYPSFDYSTQAVTYEQRLGSNGYVSVWHDACEETRELALIYDAIFPALGGDEELVSFLSAKAARYGLANPKASLADICRNIEDGILRDALRNQHKIASNYPRTPIAVATIMAVLDWDGSRDQIYKVFDEMITRATAVDGVTGEKGLSNYSAFTIQGLACMLGYFDRAMPDFLPEILRRYPKLRDTYRFHIDTWCLNAFYPRSGDCGALVQRVSTYVGVNFDKGSPASVGTVGAWIMAPSAYEFLWRLYECTGDADFVKVLYAANGGRTEGLPHDFFVRDPAGFEQGVARVIAEHGADVELRSVNKQEWHLAVLRSGRGANQRAVWLDYDAGGGHGHADAMNLGLFAYGLDLLPDFGYPPVQFGGWGSPRAVWYTLTSAHNTVLIDRANQAAGSGETRLWGDGEVVHLIQAAAPAVYSAQQYSRAVVLVDVSDSDFYLVDIFRLAGGSEHTKFVQVAPASVTTRGLSVSPAEDFGHGALLRNIRMASQAAPGWGADFSIEDIHNYLPPDARVRLRYTDFTPDCSAGLCEAWGTLGFDSTDELWLPRVIVERRGDAPLSSTFVAVIEPHAARPPVMAMRRLPVEARRGQRYGDSSIALELSLADGRRDLLVCADAENPLGLQPDFRTVRSLRQPDRHLGTDAELCFVRLNRAGRVERVALAKGRRLRVADAVLQLKDTADFFEALFNPEARVVAGDATLVERIGFLPHAR
jgi:hypothetical protein